ncbi:MAG: M50 family peptidase [Actinobacteria bacterium]|nr:M50 family peptidase [Actinomycetota bacterium]
MLSRVWADATSRQPLPDPTLVLATGLLAVVVVLLPSTWRRVRLGITIVHEAGHAVTAVLVGRRLQGIRLHADTSGVTVSRGRPRGPGMVLMLASGYLAPAALGLVAALLLADGRPLTLLWLLVLLGLAMLVWVRNGYAALALLGVGGVVAAIGWWGTAAVQSAAAYAIAWVLLVAAPRPLLELVAVRRSGRRGSDPDQLAAITPLPAMVWVLLLLAASLAGLVVGAGRLAPRLL